MLEVFLEEAREIATTGKDLVQKLKSDNSDEVALADLRRSFHTLKGSGRMSGAVEFGEFAWSMEELLNNIIAGKIEANEQIFNLYEEAVDRLQPMLDDLEKHDESNIDVPYWQEYVSKVGSSDDQLIEDAIVEAVDESSIEVVLPETEDTDISIEDESGIEADDEVELELSEEREAVELEAVAIDAEPEEIEESEEEGNEEIEEGPPQDFDEELKFNWDEDFIDPNEREDF